MVQGCTSGRESTPILIYLIKCDFLIFLIRWNKEKQKRLYEMSWKPK